jgi:SAM-dependent methyltransferase
MGSIKKQGRRDAKEIYRSGGQPRGVFPKRPLQLPSEVEAVRTEFVNAWLEELPQRFGIVEQFNHRYPLRDIDKGKRYRTLDIGAGRGEHILYEDLSNQDYYALELRSELAAEIRKRFSEVSAIVGDIQGGVDVPDGYFDRVLAIHVLEHLPDLPGALNEVKRILKPGGIFSVMIPCDPGYAYSIARNISARPLFERKYNLPYDYFIAAEHINSPKEIRDELAKRFSIEHTRHFPLPLLPLDSINLIVGFSLTH